MRHQVGQVVLLTCPTDRFRTPDREAGRAVIARRNDIVRQLMADSSGSGGDGSRSGSSSGGSGSSSAGGSPRPLLLLDLDALTQQGLPPGLAISADDYHYQCYPTTSSSFASERGALGGGVEGLVDAQRCVCVCVRPVADVAMQLWREVVA